jgi:hypothetical protein
VTGSRKAGWKSLAADIILRARADTRGLFGDSSLTNEDKALLQCEADHWLAYHPWCQFLLDCALNPLFETDIQQKDVAKKFRQTRRRSYVSFLPNHDIIELFPLSFLAEALHIQKQRLYSAAQSGKLAVEVVGGMRRCSILDVAVALAEGVLNEPQKGNGPD